MPENEGGEEGAMTEQCRFVVEWSLLVLFQVDKKNIINRHLRLAA